METKQFQAESKRLLDMMIHSIYTHKEIFLRELISNASDAIDKLYFLSLTDDQVGLSKEDFAISLAADRDARTLTIRDNGIGMTREELEQNLGVIANSGSLRFKQENAGNPDTDIIGQFGVGFYSAFMVAKRVTVRTRAYGSDAAWEWVSEGVDGYTIDSCQKQDVGTEIVLELLEDTEDERYSEFLEQYRLQGLVKKYSDYIRFPIRMDVKHSRKKELPEGETLPEGESAYEDYYENEVLNSMVPLWKKNKNELTDEDYNSFYQEKFYDYTAPIAHIHSRTEGTVTYNSLLYIPAKAPYNYYSKDYEKGLQLYASGVMIMERCGDLLPDYFSFVKGLVDSEDLSLNISREMLQHDRQLKLIAKSLEKSIKNELTKLLKNSRQQYEAFWNAFGLQLKYGVYSDYGMHKDTLKDLLLFHSSAEQKLVTLEEYVARMREEQNYIYYATGESIARIDRLPQTELVRDKGYEILYLTDSIDEFALKALGSYSEKQFKSVSAGDLELETAEETEAQKQLAEESKPMLTAMQEALNGKVQTVRLSSRLKSHPVCLTSEGELSLEMEKVLNAMPTDQKVKAERVLELNPEHPVFGKLKALYGSEAEADQAKLKDYAALLYDQALLIEGLSVEDPTAFAERICALMVE